MAGGDLIERGTHRKKVMMEYKFWRSDTISKQDVDLINESDDGITATTTSLWPIWDARRANPMSQISIFSLVCTDGQLHHVCHDKAIGHVDTLLPLNLESD